MVFIDLWHRFRERDRELAEKHAPVTTDEVPAITDEATEIVPSPLPMLSISTNDYSNWPEALNGRHAAMHCADFIACETTKVRALRSLPVHIVQKTEKGRVPTEKHDFAALLHRPNALMAWGDLVAWAVIRRDVFGTAYIRIKRGALGEPTSLVPVLNEPNVKYDKSKDITVYTIQEDIFNEPVILREDDLIILKTDLTENGITGKSIAEASAADIGLSIDLSRFYREIIENGNHMGGWLEHPDKLDPKDIVAIKESLKMQAGMDGGNTGGTRIYDRGLKYHEVSLQVADMSLVEQEKFVLEKVCRATHVSPNYIHVNSTNSSDNDISFVKETVLPEITSFEQAVQVGLDRSRSIGGKDSGYRLKFDTRGLLRGDFKTRMEGYRIGVYAGIFTRAYCCTQEDIEWLPGQDKLLQPTAYYMVDDEGNPYVPAQPTAGTRGQSDGVSGIDPKEINPEAFIKRLEPIVNDNIERIEKRARADGDTEKTRAFARSVMAPIQQTAAAIGLVINFDEEINNAIERGTNA